VALLAALSLGLATWIKPALAGVVLLYGLIQVGYCLDLKRLPLLDCIEVIETEAAGAVLAA